MVRFQEDQSHKTLASCWRWHRMRLQYYFPRDMTLLISLEHPASDRKSIVFVISLEEEIKATSMGCCPRSDLFQRKVDSLMIKATEGGPGRRWV